MLEHSCNKCGKKFTRKDSYTKHINRINSCIGKTYEDQVAINMGIMMELLKKQSEETTQLKSTIHDLTLIINKLTIKQNE